MRLTKKTDLATFLRQFGSQLNLPEKKPGRPILLGPSGPSCVGKTTTMKFIARRLPYFVRIANDDIRLFLRRSGSGSRETEAFIHKKIPAYHLAQKFLRKRYSVIVDANFATPHAKLPTLRRMLKKPKTELFLIRITAPPAFVKRKLRNKRFFKSGLLPSWKVAWQHFVRSRREFNYDALADYYIGVVDTSRPLKRQLKETIAILASAMKR